MFISGTMMANTLARVAMSQSSRIFFKLIPRCIKTIIFYKPVFRALVKKSSKSFAV
jgi:hypothetical protein